MSVQVRWATSSGEQSRVLWGTDSGLGRWTEGAEGEASSVGVVHDVLVDGLLPGTRYYYRTLTDNSESELRSFVTAPVTPRTIRLALLSDTEQDAGNPAVFEDLVSGGISVVALQRAAVDRVEEAVDAWFILGDIVDADGDASGLEDDFFPAAEPLASRVPLYVVPGSEGEIAEVYMDRLLTGPDNGGGEASGRWWQLERPGLRVLGLDTREPSRMDEQLAWVDERLAEACGDPSVELVLAVMHHPFRAELFTPTENAWSGEVVGRLEDHAVACGVLTAHAFGSSHGYSRGASRDARHLWLAPGSGGGNLDLWGQEPQADRPEIVLSDPAYGFVLLEFEPGEGLRVLRYSWGDLDQPLENELIDELFVPFDAPAPAAPGAPVPGPQGEWTAPPGDDATLQASVWQAVTCDEGVLLSEQWRQRSNIYEGAEQASSAPLTELIPPEDWEAEGVCLRVRVRSEALVWSDWSAVSELGAPSGCGGCALAPVDSRQPVWLLVMLLITGAVARRREGGQPEAALRPASFTAASREPDALRCASAACPRDKHVDPPQSG